MVMNNIQNWARKYRPCAAQDIVGQHYAVKVLQQSIITNKIHQAYLFSGKFGVGKTSICRYLVQAMNCTNLKGSDPCGQCTNCTLMQQEQFLDHLELDGARYNKAEEIEMALEPLRFLPTVGKYRSVLIDEVHMLSMHAFNLLLKRLEEPAPHVRFLLATNRIDKVPGTIVSRALHIHLRPIDQLAIASRLEHILAIEGLSLDTPVLQRIAQYSQGSMRYGINILEQVMSLGFIPVADDIDQLLCSYSPTKIEEVFQAIVRGNKSQLLASLKDIGQFDGQSFLDSLAKHILQECMKENHTSNIATEIMYSAFQEVVQAKKLLFFGDSAVIIMMLCINLQDKLVRL